VSSGRTRESPEPCAQEQGLQYLTIEQESFGGTVAHFPRNKLVMTQPATLPGFGRMNFREINKESLLKFWEDIITRARANISYGERVDRIEPRARGFSVSTNRRRLTCAYILLAIGRRERHDGSAFQERLAPGRLSPEYPPVRRPAHRRWRGDSAGGRTLLRSDAEVILAYRGP
jgi:hypothetical protein